MLYFNPTYALSLERFSINARDTVSFMRLRFLKVAPH